MPLLSGQCLWKIEHAKAIHFQKKNHAKDWYDFENLLSTIFFSVANQVFFHTNQPAVTAEYLVGSLLTIPSDVCVCLLRLKAHPSVPNASLPNLNDFPNADVPGLVKMYPDVRK